MAEALPGLYREALTFLTSAGEDGLVEQLPHLLVVGRCRCGDPFCATFYTKSPVRYASPSQAEYIDIDSEGGMILIHITDGRIVEFEVIGRDEIKAQIEELFS